jgi:hypothetical protein
MISGCVSFDELITILVIFIKIKQHDCCRPRVERLSSYMYYLHILIIIIVDFFTYI